MQVTTSDEISPREYLRNTAFSEDQATAKYPNARGYALGGLFISHSGLDTKRILNEIVLPVIFGRLPADGYFMHSRSSGGAESYKGLVQAALHWCDKFMVVISKASTHNAWVQAEVEWALERSRPILSVCVDDYGRHDLVQVLELSPGMRRHSSIQHFNFSGDLAPAQNQFTAALDELIKQSPRAYAGPDTMDPRGVKEGGP